MTAGTEFTVHTAVDGTTYSTVVSFTEFAGGNPVAPNRNDLYWTKVSGDELPFSYSADELILTFINNSTVIASTGITFPDDTVQTTAYPGVTTVARDGVVLPTTNGPVETLNHDSVLTGLTDGTYGPFTLDVVTFSVVVSGGVINSTTGLSSAGDGTVGGVIGTISGGDISETATTTTWTAPTDYPGYGSGPMGSGCVLTGPGSDTGRINIKLTDPAKQTAWLALTIGTQVTVTGTGIIPSPLTLDLTGVSGIDGDFYYQEFSTPGAIYQDSVSSIGSVSFTQGGNTTITWTVATVVQETPTAIDVTKTINKLSEGVYTLADGVEGQIMYLVPTEGGVDIGQSDSVVINIPGKSRVSGRYTGQQYTSIGGNLNTFYPFKTVATPDVTGAADVYVDTNVCILIFTDDAWQAQGGSWAV
jgi:hypothetical protein